MRATLTSVLVWLVASSAVGQETISIRAGRLLDGVGNVRTNVVIQIVGSKITEVGENTGPVTYDLSGFTVIPGLIDTHVHLTAHFDQDGRNHSDFQESPSQTILYAAENAYATLMAGFTTVQSLGSPADLDLRNAIARGRLPGPRVLTSLGAITTGTGSPEDIRATVRRLAADGADVIKVERPGVGDATRGQLRDIPDVDSLYFTMLNHNKRSVTLNTKHELGKDIFTRLIKHCDVMVENFAPGAIDRMGFPWEKIQEINPRMIYASVKGFGPGPFEDCKVYENVAQCTGGAASTTGELDGVPMVTGAQIGDTGTGLNLALGVVTALFHREKSGRGQRVTCSMQDGVLNLCRVKLRDQQRLTHGPLKEYPQYPNGVFGDATPRSGNASGGGQPGWIVKCKGWETDPDAYIYAITQAAAFPELARVIGHADWLEDPEWSTPETQANISASIREYASMQGFTEEELSSLVDHRSLIVLHKAMQFDNLQSSDIGKKKLKNKPRLVRAGKGSTKDGNKKQKRTAQMKRLQETGHVNDSISLFEDFVDI